MRGAVIKALSAPPEVAELPDVDGIRIEAVALNPLDVNVSRGLFYGGHPELPYVPGCEGSDEPATAGSSTCSAAGVESRTTGSSRNESSFPASCRWTFPTGADPGLAAAAGIAGVAGWVPVAWRANVGPGDRVLVLGARGAVGQIAVQAAKLLDADEVVGAGRSAAPGIVAFDDVGDAFGEEGFTVCIDPIWGEPLARVLAVAAPHARIVHVGQSAGPEAPLRSADVRGKELTILGHSNFAMTAEDRNRADLELLDHLVAGRIELELQRLPLEAVAEAWERQAAGPGGTVVVDLT